MAKKKRCEGAYWIVSEVAFYFLLYYLQHLLKVDANLWLSSLILWVLLNLTILACPVARKCVCN